jgi:hypothetical protein
MNKPYWATYESSKFWMLVLNKETSKLNKEDVSALVLECDRETPHFTICVLSKDEANSERKMNVTSPFVAVRLFTVENEAFIPIALSEQEHDNQRYYMVKVENEQRRDL